jgi:tellurite resistance protein
MTPGDKNILKALVAIAWADGKVARPERSVIEGLLAGFGANDEEERELLEYASRKRTLKDDLPLDELNEEERELLLGNAALLTHSDGEQSPDEKELLDKLVELLGFSPEKAEEIISSSTDGVLQLGTKPLEDA